MRNSAYSLHMKPDNENPAERAHPEACPLCSVITHASDSNDDGICVRCLGPRAIAPSATGKPDNLLFQRDQNWWAIWTPEGDRVSFEDAYPALADDADLPRAAILVDIFARLNDGKPFPFHVIPPGAQIGADGWPAESETRIIDRTSNLDAADVVGGELALHGVAS